MCGMLSFFYADNGYAEAFVDNKDGTVTDTVSGLMWSQNASPWNYVQRDTALGLVSAAKFGGKSGWRMPTKEELQGLYSHLGGSKGPFLMNLIGSIPHWSSSCDSFVKRCYMVEMLNGRVSTAWSETSYSYVWPVRNAD